jgi:hypothetical protein
VKPASFRAKNPYLMTSDIHQAVSRLIRFKENTPGITGMEPRTVVGRQGTMMSHKHQMRLATWVAVLQGVARKFNQQGKQCSHKNTC